MKNIIFITNENKLLNELTGLFPETKYRVESIQNVSESLKKITQTIYDVIVVDMESTFDFELDIISFIKQAQPLAEIIVLTDIEKIDQAVESMKKGASLYLPKPFKKEHLLLIIEKALRTREQSIYSEQYEKIILNDTVGGSGAMKRVFELAGKVAPTDTTVLLIGESGTGKELTAKVIHILSRRRHKPFIAVNCGAIPENLLESELFGYTKGAFTGAVTDKKGLIEEANSGTLFLDEIGEMPLSLQVKLLRFLEEKTIRKVGDSKSISINTRIIAATNKNLSQAIKDKQFREDLFFRINVIQISLPPLRDHKESIHALINHFLHKYSLEMQKKIHKISPEVMSILLNYNYPGNIRELGNIIQYAIVIDEDRVLSLNDLPDYLSINSPALTLPEYTTSNTATSNVSAEKTSTIMDIEKSHILNVLNEFNGNKTKTAQKLGISRSSLWRKIKRYSLNLIIPLAISLLYI
ncbi:sigma-54-dependent Fis family transcriptional regulator [Candidatus Desantisbacteria bacterium]|nr:sigma-54-dependent Fis family transcriptional regulator [Candidatus Desantisbacteria bacterium]